MTEKHIDATQALREQPYPAEAGIQRFVRREGQGVHLSIAPWSYPVGLLPWLIVAPILGGNTVILKPADQTALIGETLREAYEVIGAPPGVLQVLPMEHAHVETLIGLGRLRAVNFIGQERSIGLELLCCTCPADGRRSFHEHHARGTLRTNRLRPASRKR
jgi:acyl-CoA reductase-like NAD-dependent aldehyde dehydrogenase